MKIKTVSFLLFLILFIFPSSSDAHMIGQPPYFKVNGIYTILYPVPTSSVEDFNLPQDIAPENYLIGQKLDFELDTTQLPVIPEVLNKTKFMWDFGDGEVGSGLKQTHTYKNKGSFLQVIKAQYENDQPQILQSTLINILPDKNYQLPVAVIKVNGAISKDPLIDYFTLDMKKEVNFDASGSTSSSKIVSYTWDFGDAESGNGVSLKHKITKDLSQVYPVLRIKNEDGFMADSYVEIKEGEENQNNMQSITTSKKVVKGNFFQKYGPAMLAIASVWAVIIIIVFFKRKAKRASR
jgi:hypothetical protein